MKKALAITLCAAAVIFTAGAARAEKQKPGPGPVTLTLMERFETHSDATDSTPQRNISGETYLFSMISAYRKLDAGVNGNIYYLHKYSIDDMADIAHVLGVDVLGDITGKWKFNVGYSHSSAPKRDTLPFNDSDRFAVSATFKVNPMEKKHKRVEFKTSYNTGTDFTSGRTLAQKVQVTDNLTKKMSYTAAYQFVWGLSRTTNPTTGKCSQCREHYANQYTLDLVYRYSKKHKIILGYQFLKNLYNGARSDDSIIRLSVMRTLDN